jgi:hypothetical protein
MFEGSFAAADEAAFSMLSPDLARVWKSGAEQHYRDVRAIEMPHEVAGDYRAGGRVEDIAFDLECEAAPLRAEPLGLGFGRAEVKDGWMVKWRGKDYRIVRLTWQEGTVTLGCGSVADSSGGW